jgi:hypothetical protein
MDNVLAHCTTSHAVTKSLSGVGNITSKPSTVLISQPEAEGLNPLCIHCIHSKWSILFFSYRTSVFSKGSKNSHCKIIIEGADSKFQYHEQLHSTRNIIKCIILLVMQYMMKFKTAKLLITLLGWYLVYLCICLRLACDLRILVWFVFPKVLTNTKLCIWYDLPTIWVLVRLFAFPKVPTTTMERSRAFFAKRLLPATKQVLYIQQHYIDYNICKHKNTHIWFYLQRPCFKTKLKKFKHY